MTSAWAGTTRLELDRGWVLGLRAAVLTAPTVAIAILTHLSADGCVTGLAMVSALVLTWPAAVLLVARRRGTPSLITWLVGLQLGLHCLLSGLCDQVATGQVTPWHAFSLVPSGRMLLAHALAVVATAILLGRADAGLWATRAVLRAIGRLRPPQLVPVSPAPQAERPAGITPTFVTSLWAAPGPVRRGPPLLLAR